MKQQTIIFEIHIKFIIQKNSCVTHGMNHAQFPASFRHVGKVVNLIDVSIRSENFSFAGCNLVTASIKSL